MKLKYDEPISHFACFAFNCNPRRYDEEFQDSYKACSAFDGCYDYDSVIRALGWHFDVGIFGDMVRPLLDVEGGAVQVDPGLTPPGFNA